MAMAAKASFEALLKFKGNITGFFHFAIADIKANTL